MENIKEICKQCNSENITEDYDQVSGYDFIICDDCGYLEWSVGVA